jgi:hypothetical protein
MDEVNPSIKQELCWDGRSQSQFKEELSEINEVNPNFKV